MSRRSFASSLKSEESGARITEVAARKEVYPSLLFSWRRQVREGRLVPDRLPLFVPVRLISTACENALCHHEVRRSGDRPFDLPLHHRVTQGGRLWADEHESRDGVFRFALPMRL